MVSPDFGPLASAVSVVLGVLTYFLTMVYGSCAKILDEGIPAEAQKAARKALRRRLWRVLLIAALPLLCAFLALFYICLPTTVSVLSTSSFDLWSFDLRKTLFVYLTLGVAGCSAICTSISGRLAIRLWKSR